MAGRARTTSVLGGEQLQGPVLLSVIQNASVQNHELWQSPDAYRVIGRDVSALLRKGRNRIGRRSFTLFRARR